MKASRIIAALAATAAVIALGAYTTAQYFRSRTPAQRTNNTAAAPTFQATQQVAWDGSKTLFVPYGKQLTVETPSRNFGGTSCKIKMVITNQPGKPLHIEEVWEWSGQWVWNLSPTDTPAPGAPPSDTSMLLHTMQGGDSLLIRTIVAQSAADGMQCHIALGIAPTGGKLWSSLSSQYAEGKLRVQDLRRTLVEFFVTNQLLPAPSEPILRTRTLQYLESFTP